MVNEFEHLSIEQLETMLADVENEAYSLENDCLEQHSQALVLGETSWGREPGCDYVSDDLWQRAETIREEIEARRVKDIDEHLDNSAKPG